MISGSGPATVPDAVVGTETTIFAGRWEQLPAGKPPGFPLMIVDVDRQPRWARVGGPRRRSSSGRVGRPCRAGRPARADQDLQFGTGDRTAPGCPAPNDDHRRRLAGVSPGGGPLAVHDQQVGGREPRRTPACAPKRRSSAGRAGRPRLARRAGPVPTMISSSGPATGRHTAARPQTTITGGSEPALAERRPTCHHDRQIGTDNRAGRSCAAPNNDHPRRTSG